VWLQERLKPQAESPKADARTKKGVNELLARKRALGLKLKALKKLGGDKRDQARARFESHIANLEKLVMDAESKSKESWGVSVLAAFTGEVPSWFGY